MPLRWPHARSGPGTEGPGPATWPALRQCPPATDRGGSIQPGRTLRRSARAPATPVADARPDLQCVAGQTRHPARERIRTAAAGTGASPGRIHPGRVSAEHVESGSGGQEHAASRASQKINTRSKAIFVLAKLVHALQKLIGFTAGHEVAALVTEILGGVTYCGLCGLAGPTERGASESSDLVSRHIAQDLRQFFFQVRSQQQSQLTKLLSKFGITIDADVTSLQHCFRCAA